MKTLSRRKVDDEGGRKPAKDGPGFQVDGPRAWGWHLSGAGAEERGQAGMSAKRAAARAGGGRGGRRKGTSVGSPRCASIFRMTWGSSIVASRRMRPPQRGQASTVPSGALTGPITVTTPLGTATSPEPFRVLGLLTVSPPAAVLVPNGTQQFTALEAGTATTEVVWAVNGIVGGDATIGTVSSTGLYTAPATVPTPAGSRHKGPLSVLRGTLQKRAFERTILRGRRSMKGWSSERQRRSRTCR
jgi:hypothetical protein